MLMAEQAPYVLIVQPDDWLINPREIEDNFGTMVCFHPRYALGDRHNYRDKDDFLKEMYLNTVGKEEQGLEYYERMVNLSGGRKGADAHSNSRAVDTSLLREISKKYIMMPLYFLDHGGFAIGTVRFHNPRDSGQVGWIYVSREDVLKEFSMDKMTEALWKRAEEMLRDEVLEYDAYLRGECYGYELYQNGELTDSCWGFTGDLKDACRGMAGYLPEECRGMVEKLEEQEQPATVIRTLLRHARIQIEQAAKAREPGRQLSEVR